MNKNKVKDNKITIWKMNIDKLGTANKQGQMEQWAKQLDFNFEIAFTLTDCKNGTNGTLVQLG